MMPPLALLLLAAPLLSQEPPAWKEAAKLKGHEGPVWAAAVRPDGLQVATGGDDSIVRLWKSADGAEERKLEKADFRIQGIAYSPSGDRLAAVGDKGMALVWDLASGKRLHALQAEGPDQGLGLETVRFSPDGKRLLTSGGDYPLTLWDLDTGKALNTLKGGDSLRALEFLPGGASICFAAREADLHIVAADLKGELRTLKGETKQILCLALSPDGRRAATGHWKGQIVVWDLEKGAPALTIQAHRDTLWGLSFDPTGTWIVSGSRDKETPAGDLTMKVWNASSGAPALDLKGHTNSVRSIAFAPDGSFILSASQDGTPRLWRKK